MRPDFNQKINDEIKFDNDVIYCSLGTVATFNQRPKFFENCISYFGGKDVTLLVSLPAILIANEFKGREFPSNVVVKPFWPQLAVLKKAKVFFTHGGMNSVLEGIVNRVPLIVHPQGADQFVIAERIEELKLGVTILDPSVENIKKAYEKINSDWKMYHSNLEDFAKKIDSTGAQEKFIQVIKSLLDPIQQ